MNTGNKIFSLIIFLLMMNYFFLPHVLIPRGQYNGQKPTNDVKVNTPAKTSSTMANVPVTTFVKYNPTKIKAITMRIALSIIPMFVFIMFNF